MEKTGKQRTAGFTLVEIIVAIAIMGLVTAPICASLVLAGRLNARGRAVMEAELNVRSAVETLMEAGVQNPVQTFSNVKVVAEKDNPDDPYYKVTVSDAVEDGTEPLITVETYIRATEASTPTPGGGGG